MAIQMVGDFSASPTDLRRIDVTRPLHGEGNRRATGRSRRSRFRRAFGFSGGEAVWRGALASVVNRVTTEHDQAASNRRE